MYYASKKLLYHFFCQKVQEWAVAININVHADCGRSGPMVSLHEACSKNIHIHLHCQDKKKQPHLAGLKENIYTEIQKLRIP